MEKWIDVNEVTPAVGEYVLLLLEGDTILTGRLCTNGWSAFFADGERSTGTRHVSHWMLLPPLPGAEQKRQPKMSRDEIAVAAMQGFVSNATYYQGYSPNEDFARQAVSMADALLKELSKISPMLLTHSITYKGQILEISVYYTPMTNNVTEIKSIWVHSMGSKMPVTGIMMHLFEPGINKIIDGVDWREIYRAALEGDCFGENTNGVNMNNVHPIISSAIAPHII